MLARELELAARRFADQQSDRAREAARAPVYIGTITAATAPAAAGFGWSITLDGDVEATAHCATYTPAVGHRVICVRADDQLVVLDQLLTPA